MEKMLKVDGLKKGDKLVKIVYAQGLGGVSHEHDRMELTVVKETKTRYEVSCESRRFSCSLIKGTDLTGKWSYGQRNEYFKV